MEYGRTKTEASISSFDVGSSARSTKQKDFRRKMADMARFWSMWKMKSWSR